MDEEGSVKSRTEFRWAAGHGFYNAEVAGGAAQLEECRGVIKLKNCLCQPDCRKAI